MGRRPAACCSAQDLVKAAWVHSAPHHGVTRSLKVGKEDAIGMLMAVEMWVKRDHDAEWKRWTAWLDHIAQALSQSLESRRPSRSERLVEPHAVAGIQWDRDKLGLAGDAVARAMLDGEPRIALRGPAVRPR